MFYGIAIVETQSLTRRLAHSALPKARVVR
jgi:hypothetical protein